MTLETTLSLSLQLDPKTKNSSDKQKLYDCVFWVLLLLLFPVCVFLCFFVLCVCVFFVCLGFLGAYFSTLILSLTALVSLDDKIKVGNTAPRKATHKKTKTQTNTETKKHTDTKQQLQQNHQHTII